MADPKTILCYGDSITWGSNPYGGTRHPASHRWSDVLSAGLGKDASVITDGLRGRTTGYDEHLADCDRNGVRCLPTALYTHAPVDLLILMLGTNDMKPHIAGTAVAAVQGMRRLVQIAQQHCQGMCDGHKAKVLIVAPPPLVPTNNRETSAMFSGGIEESEKFAELYSNLAAEMGTLFFDAGRVAKASSLDGVHLDAENTMAIGTALVPVVRDIISA